MGLGPEAGVLRTELPTIDDPMTPGVLRGRWPARQCAVYFIVMDAARFAKLKRVAARPWTERTIIKCQ